MAAATQSNTLKVKELDRTYEINGLHLKRTLDSIGMTQAELARRCGYSGASRVCHIVKGGKTRIGGEYLGRMLTVLKNEGANIEGFAWK
jgi:hypothetical protein